MEEPGGSWHPKLSPVLQELQVPVPRLREVQSPAWVAVFLTSLSVMFDICSFRL